MDSEAVQDIRMRCCDSSIDCIEDTGMDCDMEFKGSSVVEHRLAPE